MERSEMLAARGSQPLGRPRGKGGQGAGARQIVKNKLMDSAVSHQVKLGSENKHPCSAAHLQGGPKKCVSSDGIAKRRGFYRNKNFTVERFECCRCGLSFSEKQPLENLRVDFKMACKVLEMLAEGIGIRATSRLTGLHQATVLSVLARAGIKAGQFCGRPSRI
jgi:transposase-like protein